MGACVDCNREIKGRAKRNRCASCYKRLLRVLKAKGTFVRLPTGGSRPSAKAPLDRVLARTTPAANGCVIFTKGSWDGYGRIEVQGKATSAHRVVYEAMIGPVGEGLVLDHTCHNEDLSCAGGRTCLHRRCVNPYHLEPVTDEENKLRGRSRAVLNLSKTHCPQGHAFSPENTKLVRRRDGRTYRRCITCHRDQTRQYTRSVRQRARSST